MLNNAPHASTQRRPATAIALLALFCACSESANSGNSGTAGLPSGFAGANIAAGSGGSSANGGTGGSTVGEGGGAGLGGSEATGGTNVAEAGSGGTDSESGAAADGGATAAPSTGVAHVFTGSTGGRLGAYLLSSSDGSLTEAGSIETGNGLDFIEVSRDGSLVLVSRDGTLAAYSYDATTDAFALLDEANTGGSGTHVALDPTGRTVVVAHYNQGAITVLPFVDQQFGNTQALQPGTNAHQANFNASGTRLYVPCLGSDYIAQYTVDPANSTVSPATTPQAEAPGGPRHMAFHPFEPIAYALAENSSQLHVFDIQAGDGLLSRRAAGSVFTQADEAYHWSSDVHITPDAKQLYAVNRTPSEIVRFAVAADGALTRAESLSLNGTVRSFAIDDESEYLLAGGDTGQVTSYRIGPNSGQLTQSAALAGLGNVNATVIRTIP